MQNSEHILTDTPPSADVRLPYGSEKHQFGDLRLAKGNGPFPAAMVVHGGFWRAKYDLVHAGFLCAALTKAGFTTWNLEYRRVGNPGGGWPGSFEDVSAGYQFLKQLTSRYPIDANRILVLGHSAGGQLVLALGAHHNSMRAVVSLAGIVNLRRAWDLHLSNDAVVEFMRGTPTEVPDHYREADPMQLSIPQAKQWLVHGTVDDTVPVDFSRDYVAAKQKRTGKEKEDAHLLEIAGAGHFDVIDPHSPAWKKIEELVQRLAA